MRRVLLLVLCISIVFTACSNEEKKKSSAIIKDKPALAVKTFTVKEETPLLSKEYSAIIKPFEDVDVIARVKGILVEKYFKEGEYIKKGQILYKIEQESYKANLDMAIANLKKSEANYQKSMKDFRRVEALLKTKSISEQKYDEYLFNYEDAKAGVQTDKAKLEQAQIEYSYTMIHAPISGIAGIKHSDLGDYVGTTDENSLLITITSINPVYVEFSLTKDDIYNFMKQIKDNSIGIELIVNDKVYKNGKLDYISTKLDTNTDTLLLRARFDNPSGELIIGEFAKIRLTNLTLKDIHIIPEEAILKTPKGAFVYVIKDSKAKLQSVDTGDIANGGIIIKSGLKSDEKVIISNIAKLRPDTKVQIISVEK